MATTDLLVARVRDLMAEETADLYSDAVEIIPLLNDGKEVMFAQLDVLPKTLTQVITGSTATYAVPDLGRMDWLLYGAAGRDLIPLRPDELRFFAGLTGSPTHYDVGLSAAGVPQITLYPTPGASDTTTLVGSYFAVPPDLAVDAAVAAHVTLDSAAANADLVVTAQEAGTAGNSITIALVDPGAEGAISVATDGFDIVVTLASSDAPAITSTAAQVKAAIDAYLPAAALVSVALVGSGAGVVDAIAETSLADGASTGATVNPSWHSRYHFLPCYHAASIMLRKDRRPEASVEMETRFRAGIVEYGRWFESRFPYRGNVVRAQPSPNTLEAEMPYPYEIG